MARGVHLGGSVSPAWSVDCLAGALLQPSCARGSQVAKIQNRVMREKAEKLCIRPRVSGKPGKIVAAS